MQHSLVHRTTLHSRASLAFCASTFRNGCSDTAIQLRKLRGLPPFPHATTGPLLPLQRVVGCLVGTVLRGLGLAQDGLSKEVSELLRAGPCRERVGIMHCAVTSSGSCDL
jgi:hypothetical protein